MRIGLVTASFLPSVGGVEWKVHYLGAEYVRRGHDVMVFTIRPPAELRDQPLMVGPTYGLKRCGYQVRGLGRSGLNGWLVCRAILAEHRRRPFDVLHCHHLCQPTAWGLWVKRRTGVPVVVTTCGDDVYAVERLQYGVRLDPRLDRLVRTNSKQVEVIGSISRAVRGELEAMGTTARLVDIPNGVPWEEFQTGPSRLLRERLGLSDEDVIVLSVGRNINFKRYDLGVPAFAKAVTDRPGVYYVLVGRDLEPLGRLARECGVEDRVKLVDQVPLGSLPAMFHSADIFFNPSELEGFAQVNAQALASGLPCVVTDAPGNVDAADHGGALVAKCYDTDSMAECLRALIDDPARRRALGREAHAGSGHYAWSRIAEQYLAVFEGLRGRR